MCKLTFLLDPPVSRGKFGVFEHTHTHIPTIGQPTSLSSDLGTFVTFSTWYYSRRQLTKLRPQISSNTHSSGFNAPHPAHLHRRAKTSVSLRLKPHADRLPCCFNSAQMQAMLFWVTGSECSVAGSSGAPCSGITLPGLPRGRGPHSA